MQRDRSRRRSRECRRSLVNTNGPHEELADETFRHPVPEVCPTYRLGALFDSGNETGRRESPLRPAGPSVRDGHGRGRGDISPPTFLGIEPHLALIRHRAGTIFHRGPMPGWPRPPDQECRVEASRTASARRPLRWERPRRGARRTSMPPLCKPLGRPGYSGRHLCRAVDPLRSCLLARPSRPASTPVRSRGLFLL
jgi:hypothetical protein